MFRAVLVVFGLLGSLLVLSACGQKGALYLSDKSSQKTQPDTGIFIKENQAEVLPELVLMNHVKVAGELAQINQNNVPSWQAVLTADAGETNLVRYVVFDNSLLTPTQPRTMLIGTVQNAKLAKVNYTAQQVIPKGSYLRFRAIESGVKYVPKLIASARAYFQQNKNIRHRNAPDFLIENQQAIDLYIAVEKMR